MGHEIAAAIRRARDAGKPLAVIFPVGPMGMYRWAVYFLQHWGVSCDHVHGFNMDEWSDAQGNTMPAASPAAFQNAMQEAFYGPLGELTVPPEAAALRDEGPVAEVFQANRAAQEPGGRPGGDLRHRPGLPHRLLGAALRRRVRQRRGVDGPAVPPAAPGCTR